LRGVDFLERINIVSYNATAQYYLGETFFEIGEHQKSIDHYEKAVGLMEQNKTYPSFINLNRVGAARSRVINEEKNVNLESLYGYVYESKAKLFAGRMRRYIGQILLDIDSERSSDSSDWIKKAIEADKRNGMMFDLGRDYTAYAELFKRKGDKTEAKEKLTKAINIYKECGADGWEEKAEKDLASLS
jgi:tetratricopeptide (TPR) repeat protein